MSQVSRRTFLRQASVSAAAVGVAATVPSFLRNGVKPSKSAATPAIRTGRIAQDGPMVAHIDDVSSGEIHLLMGTRQVTYRNPELAQQLLQAAQ